MISPSPPPGFRDSSPEIFLQRRYLVEVLRKKFVQYGFMPLETPAVERLSTLMGKYGEEGDQLVFKLLNTGDVLASLTADDLVERRVGTLQKISKRGLRYDLTVPLARYIAQHKHMLHFPFKRYQVQPVWRADRPQRGRYREFYQCDVDVVGSSSLFYEASLLALVYEGLVALGITSFTIHVNHRKLLSALVDYLDGTVEETLLCQTLDKLDKIGMEAVCALLVEGGLAPTGVQQLQLLLDSCSDSMEEIVRLRQYLGAIALGEAALDDLAQILSYLNHFNPAIAKKLSLTPTLARGLSYYTGPIFEVKVADAQMGSVVGGGRYDGLTKIFGGAEMPGVGLSFGLDRLHDIMRVQGLFPAGLMSSTKLLLVPMEAAMEGVAIGYLVKLRARGIAVELYPAGARLKKSFSYADKKNIHWVAVVGSEEIAVGKLTLRNMVTGEQLLCPFSTLEDRLCKG